MARDSSACESTGLTLNMGAVSEEPGLTLTEGTELLRQGHRFQTIRVNLSGAGAAAQDWGELLELLQLAEQTPVVIVTEADEPAQAGRMAWRESLAGWEQAGPSQLDDSRQPAVAATLADIAPTEFQPLVQRYAACLAYSLTPAATRREEVLAGMLYELAALLGRLVAGPQEVVELHRQAVTRVCREADPAQLRLVDEGRLRLLQLMGYLVSVYREETVAWREDE